MQQHGAAALHPRDLLCAAPHSLALHTCPPPIPPGIACAAYHPPGCAPPAVRATVARLSPFHPPSPRAFLARSPA